MEESRLKVVKGNYLRWKGKEYAYVQRLGNGKLEFRCMEGDYPLYWTDAELSENTNHNGAELLKSALQLKCNTNSTKVISPKQLRKARIKVAFILKFRDSGVNPDSEKGQEMIDEIKDDLMVRFSIELTKIPKKSTIYRWIEAAPLDVTIDSVLDGNQSRGFASWDRLPLWAKEIIEKVAEELYLNKQRLSVSTCHGEVEDRVEKYAALHKFPIPKTPYSLFLKYLKSLDLFLVIEKRYGKYVAERKLKTVFPRPRPTRPFQILELDATVLNIRVVWRGVVIRKRPTITVIIDVYSRMIVGFHLGFDPPSVATVAEALRNALFHKGYVAKMQGVKGRWPCHGRPELIIVDRAKENLSNDVLRMASEVGLTIMALPGRSPWLKGVVERFFRSLNSLLHELPGTTFSNPNDKGDYDSEENANLTLDELYVLIHMWIIDRYHPAFHLGLFEHQFMFSPEEAWDLGIKDYEIDPMGSVEKLKLWTMRTVDCTLSREGVRLEWLHFNSKETQPWFRDQTLNPLKDLTPDSFKTQLKYNSNNLTSVMVKHPQRDEWLEMPIVETQLEYARGLTYWQHITLRRLALKDLGIKRARSHREQARIVRRAHQFKEKVLGSIDELVAENPRLAAVGSTASVGDEYVVPSAPVQKPSDQKSSAGEFTFVADDNFDPYKAVKELK